MLTLSEAQDMARKRLADVVPPSVDLVFLDDSSIAKPYGWILFYSSRQFVETGDINFALGGNGPVVVEHDGRVHLLTSAVPPEESVAAFERERGLKG